MKPTHVIFELKDKFSELNKKFKSLPKGNYPEEIIKNLAERERIIGKLEFITDSESSHVVNVNWSDILEKHFNSDITLSEFFKVLEDNYIVFTKQK